MQRKCWKLFVAALVLATAPLGNGDVHAGLIASFDRIDEVASSVSSFPEPPRQREPWSAPDADLPPNYFSATAALFEQGMADPRGCDYRDITFVVGDVRRGTGEVVNTRGWVLPREGEQSFAVAWNGLLYPVIAVGESGDLRADVLAAIRESEGRVWRTWNAYPERETVVPDTRFAIQGCLLLRLGEADLARDVWSAIEANKRARFEGLPDGGEEEVEPRKLPDTDPYLDWASEWAWGLFERAVVAHMRGDDRMALASARFLAAVSPSIEAEAQRRGYRVPEYHGSPSLRPGYLQFLGPLPALLADQERRLQRSEPLMSVEDIALIEDQEARIQMLIDHLDQVALRQMGQPAPIEPVRYDRIAAALLKEGEAAIEPLLRCLETDCTNGLTRSVGYSRYFQRSRRIHSVDWTIAQILFDLMNARLEEVGFDRNALYSGDLSPSEIASTFREYWRGFGHLSLPERWYRTLADEDAGAQAWMSVLQKMLMPPRVNGERDETRMAGDPLRAKTSPSVTELLVRNAESLVEAAGDRRECSDAARFILEAAKWEAAPLVPVAAELQRRITVGVRDDTWREESPVNREARFIASLAVLRGRHGDTYGFDEYAAWIEPLEPSRLRDVDVGVLEPFWRFLDYPELRGSRSRMFGDADSPWGTISWMLEASHSWREAVASPLLMVPEFRALVVRELRNQAPEGEATYLGEGSAAIDYFGGGRSQGGGHEGAGDIETGTKVTFRRSDEVAKRLSSIHGFPAFSFFWPEDRRDEAIAAMANVLVTSPDRLRIKERPAAYGGPFVELTDKTR